MPVLRCSAIALLMMLAGCSSNAASGDFSTRPPSLHVGEVALSSGEPGVAISVAENQLALDPNNMNALLLRSDAQAAIGQPDAARAGYARVLANRPGSVGASLGLARLLMSTDPAGAEALLAPVAARGDATAPVWNNLGVARDLLGRHAEAQDAYRRALAADPTMQSAQVNLAHSLTLGAAAR